MVPANGGQVVIGGLSALPLSTLDITAVHGGSGDKVVSFQEIE
jgi:hypothetical protein